MYPTEQKLIYTSPANKKYDPLVIYRKLILNSQGKINEHLSNWRATDSGNTPENQVISAYSESELVNISRATFELKPFDEGKGDFDSTALDILCHYLEWTAKKDQPELK